MGVGKLPLIVSALNTNNYTYQVILTNICLFIDCFRLNVTEFIRHVKLVVDIQFRRTEQFYKLISGYSATFVNRTATNCNGTERLTQIEIHKILWHRIKWHSKFSYYANVHYYFQSSRCFARPRLVKTQIYINHL